MLDEKTGKMEATVSFKVLTITVESLERPKLEMPLAEMPLDTDLLPKLPSSF